MRALAEDGGHGAVRPHPLLLAGAGNEGRTFPGVPGILSRNGCGRRAATAGAHGVLGGGGRGNGGGKGSWKTGNRMKIEGQKLTLFYIEAYASDIRTLKTLYSLVARIMTCRTRTTIVSSGSPCRTNRKKFGELERFRFVLYFIDRLHQPDQLAAPNELDARLVAGLNLTAERAPEQPLNESPALTVRPQACPRSSPPPRIAEPGWHPCL